VADEIAPPQNTFEGPGTNQNIDRQRAMLNDLIAVEGQHGRQIYDQQAPQAQAALATQVAQAPHTTDARKAVYDAFIRDAQAAQGQHDRTMQRQAATNHHFMNQAKEAVPIHQQNLAAQTEALRMRYEHEKEMERQRLAAQRAAQRASSASANLTYDQKKAKALEAANLDQDVKRELLKGVPREQWTASDAALMNAATGKADPKEIAASFGFETNWDNAQAREAQAVIDALFKEDVTFADVMSTLQSGGWDDRIVTSYALANAGRWGAGWNDVRSALGR